VGILDNFEKGLERAVNGVFAKTFRSGLQPVELTSALRRELDTKAAIVSRDRTLAPNSFVMDLSEPDYARMSAMGESLIDELTGFVREYATSQNYQFAGAVSVSLTEDKSLIEGVLRLHSENVKGDVVWAPFVEIAGRRYPLRSRTVIGRGSDADITLDDTGISRKHVEILGDGTRAQARDLGSTNGSQLNGKPLKTAALEPDSVITLGRSRVVFKVLPQAKPDSSPSQPQGFWSER
jgi:hypothetical protein